MRMMSKVRVKSVKKRKRATGKWVKTNVLIGDESLREYVPTTRRLSAGSLRSMLDSHRMVYVKPTFGSLGKGVMRVERTPHEAGERYSYQIGDRQSAFPSYDALYRSIRQSSRGKGYLVQKGVHLLTYEGRRFDLRVVVQQSPSGGYETTGIVARIAHPGKIVTNGSQGGTILPAEQVLRPYANPVRIHALMGKLSEIGVAAMKRLRGKFPALKEIGLDIALDRELRPWILEVNFRPDHCPFAILQNKTMINRIVHYGRQYGRTYRLKCNTAKPTL